MGTPMHDRDELDEFLSQQLARLHAPSGYEERVLAGTHTRVRRIRRRRNIAVGVTTLAVGGVIAGAAIAAPGLLGTDEPLRPAGNSSSALPQPTGTRTSAEPSPPVATSLPAPSDLPTDNPTSDSPSTPEGPSTPEAPSIAATDPSRGVSAVSPSEVPITADLLPSKSELPPGTTYWTVPEPYAGPARVSDLPALDIYERTPLFNGLACDVAPELKGTVNNIGTGVMESVYDPDEQSVSLNLGVVDTPAGQATHALEATFAGDGVCILGQGVTRHEVRADGGSLITVLQLGPHSSVAVIQRGDRILSASASDLQGRAGMTSLELDEMAIGYAEMMLSAQVKGETSQGGASG